METSKETNTTAHADSSGVETPTLSAEDLLASIDRESSFRRLVGVSALVVSGIAIAFSLFQLYTASIALLPARMQRAAHLGFVLVLAISCIRSPRPRRQKIPWHDIGLAALRRRWSVT
jgi:TRAP-type uncharacterized transport system fused permease subunit